MTTIDGMPWLEAFPFGEDGPTYGDWNRLVLAPLSQRERYCMCYHPFPGMINFAGLGCDFCGQVVTEASSGPEAKRMRTEATLAAYPQLRRNDSGD